MLGVGPAGPVRRVDAPPAGGGRGAVAPAPPLADERDAWVVLAGVHGIGPISFARLLDAYGSAAATLEAARRPRSARELVAASRGRDGVHPAVTFETARAVVAAAHDLDGRLAAVRRSGVWVVTLAEGAYPRRLRSIDLPPPVLFVRGDAVALDAARAVAIVGTRRPTDTGRTLAGRIAATVASLGATVVSGLAFGIDAAAHAAVVRSGSPTVAVLGGGHEHLYPAPHRGLAEAIVDGGGAIVSEFAPDVLPSRGTFPRRNRIISGLSDATVVVEAGLRSGALTTAAWALEQGRGLYIVPGRVGDPTVAGCLAFLREAAGEARIVAGLAELIEDLGLVGTADGSSPGADTTDADTRAPGGGHRTVRAPDLDALVATLGPVEGAIARLVAAGTATVDELVAATGSRGATVLGALTSLEVRGLVLEAFGRYRAAGPLALVPEPARPTVKTTPPDLPGLRRDAA